MSCAQKSCRYRLDRRRVLGERARGAATETRDFRGEGSSDFGLQLYYARDDARRQATAAGFGNCTEIYQKLWPYTATVIWRCTRISV